MKLAWFGVEEWLNPMDSLARINLGSSCVSALRMDELFDLTGEDLDAFLNEMRTMSLHYHHGDATGSPRIKAAVAGIYPKGNVKPEEVMITHPAVSLAAVVGVPHESHGEEIKAVAEKLLPLAGQGLGWLCPAALGLVIGLAIHVYRLRKA